MSLAHDVIQILQKQEVGLAEPELFMLRTIWGFYHKTRLIEFISLCQAIEDRLDPQSKWHELTVSSICEKYKIPRSTFYRKKKILHDQGLWGLAPKRRGPKGSRLSGQIKRRIKELRTYQISTKSISAMFPASKPCEFFVVVVIL